MCCQSWWARRQPRRWKVRVSRVGASLKAALGRAAFAFSDTAVDGSVRSQGGGAYNGHFWALPLVTCPL